MEPWEGAKGNTPEPHTHRTQSRASVSPGLERVRERARQGKKERFTALLHHVTVDLLRTSYLKIKRDAAPGVDGTTWREYGQDLEAKLVDLHGRVHRGAYRALPSRRKFIQKEDGRERPLGIAALEDKIVSVPWWRCSMRFTSKISSAFHTDFDQDAVNTMRWMHSRLGLRARR